MVTVLAPMAGWVCPLGEVPDPVFADRILGDGLAIDPTGTAVCAPCDGQIVTLAGHAFTVRGTGGLEILTHVGLETVALKGRGFTPVVREGQAVRAGDVVLNLDLDFLARHAKSLISPVIVAAEGFRILRRNEGCEIAAREPLMEVVPEHASPTLASDTAAVTGKAIVAGEHGLHARPAALVATTAKRFAGSVMLSCRGKTADGKSATAIMALGAARGDEIAIVALSRAAVEAIAAVITAAGEKPHRVLTAVAPPRVLSANTATLLHGVPAAPGRAAGTAVVLRRGDVEIVETGNGLAAETKALREAVAGVRARLQIAASGADRIRREILTAHIALLDDPGLLAAAEKAVVEGKSAAFAWRKVCRAAAGTLRAMADERMRERAGDLLDLERQVLAALTGETDEPARALPADAILIAEEILPSDLKPGIAGFVSAGGGPTAHAAILAAGMAIPAVVGAGAAVLAVPDGIAVLLDADAGTLDLNPDAAALAETRQRAAAAAARDAVERAAAHTDCTTACGARVEVFANLGKGATEAGEAVGFGAEGCGVLRTEFLFLDRETPPSEDEQLAAYQGIADALAGRPFIIRTFDIGADKPVPYLRFPAEDNPQLGLRGVRTATVWPDLLKTQLKAAARVKGRVKIMLPMITGTHEIQSVRALLTEMGVALPLGAMVETPSSAMLADQLAGTTDFLSIGTNDLTQYVLAVDRGHASLSDMLDALHPAVLRLIARTAEAGKAAGKPVGVCGSLAADPLAAPLLIGLGVGELSVPPPVIPRLKAAIRRLTVETCRAAAAQALTLETPAAVRAFVKANFSGEDHS
jgi:phosphocarrier protein FPr/phosphocarrier protein